MATISRDTTHYVLEDEFIRKNEISKKMMKEINRRRDNKLIKELSGGNYVRTEKEIG